MAATERKLLHSCGSVLDREGCVLGAKEARPQVEGVDMSDPVCCAETDGTYIKVASIGFDLKVLLRTFRFQLSAREWF